MTGTIVVPEDLANDLRIAAVVQLASACDDFDTSLSGFVEPAAWDHLPERLAALEARIQIVRQLGTVAGAPVAEPVSCLVVESLANDAGCQILDDVRDHMNERADTTNAGASFDIVTRMAAHGRELLALAKRAGAYESDG